MSWFIPIAMLVYIYIYIFVFFLMVVYKVNVYNPITFPIAVAENTESRPLRPLLLLDCGRRPQGAPRGPWGPCGRGAGQGGGGPK